MVLNGFWDFFTKWYQDKFYWINIFLWKSLLCKVKRDSNVSYQNIKFDECSKCECHSTPEDMASKII